ncbi:hypothetical protein [Alkalimarinus alittae]|uniref:Uncharacterized protein n=1 Tax=Alkalimarinus alittae TaxID=2961619 RepID=A0ABY6MXV1_9ALTE|nr:hypothetical protein [Alkalimarinus alittae]UZE94609.1 hypothetical protein NKI27_10970 [Alkalimarinus alittae]
MISLLIHASELTLLGLLAYLAYQVATLFNNQQIAVSDNTVEPTSPKLKLNAINHPLSANQNLHRRNSRVESITSSQIFTGIQLFEIKRNGINPLSPAQEWIGSGISYYLLGAANAITEHFDCTGTDKDDVMRYLLTKNLSYSEELADRFISNLYHSDEQAVEKNAYTAGIDAARTWLSKKFIPEEHSLLNNLNSLGFVA